MLGAILLYFSKVYQYLSGVQTELRPYFFRLNSFSKTFFKKQEAKPRFWNEVSPLGEEESEKGAPTSRPPAYRSETLLSPFFDSLFIIDILVAGSDPLQ